MALLAAAALATVVLTLLPSGIPRTQRASLVLAYISLAALLATLAIGPLRVIRGRANPVSNDLRRDLGILAGISGLAHVVFAFQHHLGGVVARYFFSSNRLAPSNLRRDSFGVANDIGLLAALLLVLLMAISNDWSLRRLGRNWKRVQRMAYALAVLTVAHTALFWVVTHRRPPVVLLAALAVGSVTALQLVGFARHPGRLRREQAPRTAGSD